MDSHDGAHISSKVSSARGHCEIFGWVDAISINHEVTVILVYRRRFAPISTVEEFRQGFPLQKVDGMHIEPGTVTREDDGMSLCDQVRSCRRLQCCFCLDGLPIRNAFYSLSCAPLYVSILLRGALLFLRLVIHTSHLVVLLFISLIAASGRAGSV